MRRAQEPLLFGSKAENICSQRVFRLLTQSGHSHCGTLDHLFVREILNVLVVWEAFHRKCFRKSRSGYAIEINGVPISHRFRLRRLVEQTSFEPLLAISDIQTNRSLIALPRQRDKAIFSASGNPGVWKCLGAKFSTLPIHFLIRRPFELQIWSFFPRREGNFAPN